MDAVSEAPTQEEINAAILKPKKPRKPAKKATKPKAKKAKAAPKKKAVKKANAKKPAKKVAKVSGGVVRTERLDMRLSKVEKARVIAKAKKLRRTITSVVLEAIEKIK